MATEIAMRLGAPSVGSRQSNNGCDANSCREREAPYNEVEKWTGGVTIARGGGTPGVERVGTVLKPGLI